MSSSRNEEFVRIDMLAHEAKRLFDSGYTNPATDMPGRVSTRDGRSDISVAIEVWFYLRGALHGMEQQARRQSEENW